MINTTSLEFDLSGTVAPAGFTPPAGVTDLYIGDPGNADWIGQSATATSVSGSAAGLSLSSGSLTSFADGDYIRLDFGSALDFTTGQSVNLSVSFDDANVLLNTANIDVNDLIVTWGFNSSDTDPFPDSTYQIGAVPEPGSFALLMGLGTLGFLAARRRPLRA